MNALLRHALCGNVLARNVLAGCAIGLLICSTACRRNPASAEAPVHREIVLVVLGNEPLDETTPTVDMVARVKKAVEFQKKNPGAVLVFTGGTTVGHVSEARMMASIATNLGAAIESIQLEEQALTTVENAKFSAAIVLRVHPKRILIVSKSDHLTWALPIFQKHDVFKTAEPLACEVPREESIAQMRDYLKHHDNPRVRQRIQNLTYRQPGAD